MKARCEPRHREKSPHVAVPCVPLQHEHSVFSRLPWGCRGGGWQEEVTHGERGGEGSIRMDLSEKRSHQRRNKASLCSPLQLEVGHSSLEEANSHAGVLGHCLVKCLGTKMPMDRQGLQFYHPCVTQSRQMTSGRGPRNSIGPQDSHLQIEVSCTSRGLQSSCLCACIPIQFSLVPQPESA